ncbi:hypothetical protein [Caldiplasma sukawensis]
MNLEDLYSLLFDIYGDLKWWPAETKEEVVIGAILTQNTTWRNVEKAIDNLKNKGICSLKGILFSEKDIVKEAIRSAGFYNQKYTYLKNISDAIVREGGIEILKNYSTDDLHKFFSSIKGVGKETEDSIILYVFERKAFVDDKYTRRIFSRLGITNTEGKKLPDHVIECAEREFNVEQLKNLHAMIVYLGKDICKSKPDCNRCPLKNDCETGINNLLK